MRKLFGGFLGLLAALFLGLAYAQLASAEEPDCKSALAKKIAELEAQDKGGVLKLQRQITYFKLAAQTVDSKKKTVEDYIRSQEDLLKKLDEKGEISDRLLKLYQSSGAEAADKDKATARLSETIEKAKKASYWKPVTRFKNEELSAFVMAHEMLHKGDSPFKEADSAILWLDSEISNGVEKATRRGSAVANLNEASSWIVRMTGVIHDSFSAESLKTMAAEKQKELDAAMDKIVDQYRGELAKSCSALKNCKDCKVSEEDKENGLIGAMSLIKKKYLTDSKFKDEKIQAKIAKTAKDYHVEVEADVNSKDKKTEETKTEEKKPEEKKPVIQSKPGVQKPLLDTKSVETSSKDDNPYRTGDDKLDETDGKKTDEKKVETKPAEVKKTEEKKVETKPAEQKKPALKTETQVSKKTDRIDAVAAGVDRHVEPITVNDCTIAVNYKRDGKGKVAVQYEMTNQKTHATAKGAYTTEEKKNGLVESIFRPDIAVKDLKSTCPPPAPK